MYEFVYFNTYYRKYKHYIIDTTKILYMSKNDCEDYELNICILGTILFFNFPLKEERDKLFSDIYKIMKGEDK